MPGRSPSVESVVQAAVRVQGNRVALQAVHDEVGNPAGVIQPRLAAAFHRGRGFPFLVEFAQVRLEIPRFVGLVFNGPFDVVVGRIANYRYLPAFGSEPEHIMSGLNFGHLSRLGGLLVHPILQSGARGVDGRYLVNARPGQNVLDEGANGEEGLGRAAGGFIQEFGQSMVGGKPAPTVEPTVRVANFNHETNCARSVHALVNPSSIFGQIQGAGKCLSRCL